MADDLNLLHGTVTDGGGDKTFNDPGNANDGVDTSIAEVPSYAAGAGTYHAYLETDLGAGYDVSEVVVWGDVECGADPIMHWSIEYSDDGSSWTPADYTASEMGTQGNVTHRERFVLAATENHQYWRVHYQTTIVGLGFRCGTQIHTFEIFGETAPTEPPVDPGYEPPDPGHAILEIYVHDEDASRWDVATWGDDDGIIEGTEGVWSAAGWQDVTPQGVNAHIRWGSSRPERGILAAQEAQDWLVVTYDPDRVLDPGNMDGPYWPQLVSGVPIRISSSASGRVIRTGLIDRISYKHKAPDYRGEIRASSTIALAWRSDVPSDAILGDTLRDRLRDVLLTSGVEIGGISILAGTSTIDNYPDLPLSAKLAGEHNMWEHMYKAAEEVLWVLYEDAAGTLQVRPWGGPMDRGATITYANLEDLEAASSEDGIYSVVRVTDDTSVVIERVAAPLPRYGRRVYTRDETTIDADAWADAVLADRAWPGVVYTPGTVWCFDEADVDFMASLEIMERLTISVPGVLEVSGKLLGMELWVEARTNQRTRWLFLPRMSTDGGSAIDSDLIVSDQDGDYLAADDGSGDLLEAG